MLLLILLLFFLPFQSDPPPGTVKVGEFYVDRTEMLNIHWLEYQHYMKQELNPSEQWKISPGSSNNWYRLPGRRYEPITLITYEQAKSYCEWRSGVISQKLGKEIIYRLPTVEEWNLIAQQIILEEEGKIMKSLNKLKKRLSKAGETYYLESRERPKNKVYDLFSNVSEMTANKGIAKGGNNYGLLKNDDIYQSFNYESPNAYLGFRCIAEVKN